MKGASPRLVIGLLAGLRVTVGVGVGLSLFPQRFGASMGQDQPDMLMTRYFAVRETALGIGGLLAVLEGSPRALHTWAGLGALVDVGDLAAALTAALAGNGAVVPHAVLAAGGLAIEALALARVRTRTTVDASINRSR